MASAAIAFHPYVMVVTVWNKELERQGCPHLVYAIRPCTQDPTLDGADEARFREYAALQPRFAERIGFKTEMIVMHLTDAQVNPFVPGKARLTVFRETRMVRKNEYAVKIDSVSANLTPTEEHLYSMDLLESRDPQVVGITATHHTMDAACKEWTQEKREADMNVVYGWIRNPATYPYPAGDRTVYRTADGTRQGLAVDTRFEQLARQPQYASEYTRHKKLADTLRLQTDAQAKEIASLKATVEEMRKEALYRRAENRMMRDMCRYRDKYGWREVPVDVSAMMDVSTHQEVADFFGSPDHSYEVDYPTHPDEVGRCVYVVDPAVEWRQWGDLYKQGHWEEERKEPGPVSGPLPIPVQAATKPPPHRKRQRVEEAAAAARV